MALIYHRKNKISNVLRNFDCAENNIINNLASLSNHQQKKVNQKELFLLMLSIFIASIAYGLLLVFIAIRLEQNTQNSLLISLSTIVQIGAGVIFSQFLPNFAKKVGLVKSIIVSTVITAFSALCLYKFISFYLWLIVVYCLGTSLFTTNITRNTLMINLAEPKKRAFIIALGSTLASCGNALGPVLLNFFNWQDNFFTFLCIAGIFLASAFILSKVQTEEISIAEQKNVSLWKYLIYSPKIMISGFSYSFILTSCMSFAVIYGLKIGMEPHKASLLLSAFLFGNICYVPISWFCSVIKLKLLMIIGAIFSLLCIVYIFIFLNTNNIFWLFFCLFVSLSLMKLSTIILINEKYNNTQRLIANSAFSRLTLLGSISGLVVVGILNIFYPQKGLWLGSGFMLLLFLIFCLGNYFYKLYYRKIIFSSLSIFKLHSQ